MSARFSFGAAAALAAASATAPWARGQTLEEICSGEVVPFEAPPFSTFDRDGNEAIDEAEAARCEALAIVFDALDLDNDELVTRAEYASFAALWSQRDRSFDGEPD